GPEHPRPGHHAWNARRGHGRRAVHGPGRPGRPGAALHPQWRRAQPRRAAVQGRRAQAGQLPAGLRCRRLLPRPGCDAPRSAFPGSGVAGFRHCPPRGALPRTPAGEPMELLDLPRLV
ncbi:MAG: 5-hydroxyisourate hydrolase, partial [uncultured Ramlibacter sp.]